MSDSISVKDIARMAGVSVATVSRVINQNGRFSKETEQRILDIIEEYHYHPNQFARGLRNSSSNIVGVLVPEIANAFFTRMLPEIQRLLMLNGFLTVIYSTNEDASLESQYIKMFRSQKVAGLIFLSGSANTNSEARRESEVLLAETPCVYFDLEPAAFHGIPQKNYVYLESDSFGGGVLAARTLLESGCRYPACVGFPQRHISHGRRMDGFRYMLSESPDQINGSAIIAAQHISIGAGMSATENLLRLHPHVDGIFFTNDILAIGGLFVCKMKNISVPDSIKIIGFDNLTPSWKMEPAITSVSQDVESYAHLAVDSLCLMIEKKQIKQRYYKLSNCLMEGKTT